MSEEIGIGKSTQYIDMTGAVISAKVMCDILGKFPTGEIWFVRDGHPYVKIVNIGAYQQVYASNEQSPV